MRTVTAKVEKIRCTKCMGKGRITAYSHIIGGICFACNGKGYFTRKVKSQATIKRSLAKKAQKKAYHSFRSELYNQEIERCKPLVKQFVEVSEDHNFYETHVMEWAIVKGIWNLEAPTFKEWIKTNPWQNWK